MAKKIAERRLVYDRDGNEIGYATTYIADGYMLLPEHTEEQRNEALAVCRALLRYVRLCGVCLRPATYARAMTDLCDTCAADPKLEWPDPLGKEACLLSQAETVRKALRGLEI